MTARHANDDDDGTATLCGRDRSLVAMDNTFPTCGTCRRVIRSRCAEHGKGCRTCPPTARMGA